MSRELVVLRCKQCGDVFSSEDEEASCPSCSSQSVEIAQEPLL